MGKKTTPHLPTGRARSFQFNSTAGAKVMEFMELKRASRTLMLFQAPKGNGFGAENLLLNIIHSTSKNGDDNKNGSIVKNVP